MILSVSEFVQNILQQGGLAVLSVVALGWGWHESQSRDKERAESQRQAQAERDNFNRMLEKERGETQKLQTEVMRMATETSQTNALNRQTLAELQKALESKRSRSTAK